MKNMLILSVFALLISCTPKQADNEIIYWVNSYTVDCEGIDTMNCMLVQKGEKIADDQWQNFYSKIEGFEFEAGFIYKLLVKEEMIKNAAADTSTVKCSLLKIIEKNVDNRFLLEGIWETNKIEGSLIEPDSMQGSSGIPQIRIDITKMHISGSDGCNNFGGCIKRIKMDTIDIAPLAATKMMCPNMTITNQFNKALSKVKIFKVNKDTLLLLNEAGSAMLELNKAPEPQLLINDIWVAEFINGESVNANAPQLEIHVVQMEVMGTDGCNNFMGKITKLTDNELEIGPLAATRKMCPNMSVADKFNKVLSQVKKYKCGKLSLKLFDDQEKQLILLKKAN